MPEIAVLVPMLGRGAMVEPFLESLEESSGTDPLVLFLCSHERPDDAFDVAAAGGQAIVVPFDLRGGDYARKVNLGVQLTETPWVFQAAIDVKFHKGWDEELLRRGAAERFGVVGSNDLGNPLTRAGRHATHSLIRRTYIEEHGTVDEPGKALHEGYFHCWVDNELVETAACRGAWVAARSSRVEHLHHIWHKSERDATYRRGDSQFREDHALFKMRRPLWRSRLVAPRRSH